MNVYRLADDGTAQIVQEAQFYPVISENKIIGLLQVYTYDAGTAFAYSEAQAEDMNEKAENGIALLIQDTLTYVVQDTDVSEYTTSVDIAFVSPFAEAVALDVSASTDDVCDLLPYASVPSSYSLSVSKVLQPSRTSCWAACVVCVGKYYYPATAYTVSDVEATVGLENQGATISQTKNALYQVYGYQSSSVKYSLTASQAMEYVYGGYPILAGCTYGASTGHMVVIRGYSSSSTGMSLHLMDPETGYLTVSVISGSTLSFSYSGTTFTVSTYIY